MARSLGFRTLRRCVRLGLKDLNLSGCTQVNLRRCATETPEDWQVCSVIGKSSVTQELWRRRDTLDPEIIESHAIRYNFAGSEDLRHEYVANTGRVRIGKLLEDLDALAGNVAFDWCQPVRSRDGRDVLLVTAAVDRIRFTRPLSITEDVMATGKIIWTGNSSMLARIQIHGGEGFDLNNPESGEHLLEADFVYVARDRTTLKSAKIPQMEPRSDRQKLQFMEGRLKATEKRWGVSTVSSVTHQKEITKLLERGETFQDLPALVCGKQRQVLMRSSSLENTVLTKPQNRNTAGRVFGGYLMRQAYELAWCTGLIFSGTNPRFVEISEFSFHKPVPVGCLLRLKSRVVYTKDSLCVVEVLIKVVQPEQNLSFRSNRITVAFDAGTPLPMIVPSTTGEAVSFLAAEAHDWNSP